MHYDEITKSLNLYQGICYDNRNKYPVKDK